MTKAKKKKSPRSVAMKASKISAAVRRPKTKTSRSRIGRPVELPPAAVIVGVLVAALRFVHAAASRLEEGASALRQRSIGDLMNTFTDLGKMEPLALFGGAVLAGFAISRFLKSSADNSR